MRPKLNEKLLAKRLLALEQRYRAVSYVRWLNRVPVCEAELVLLAIQNGCLPVPHEVLLDQLMRRSHEHWLANDMWRCCTAPDEPFDPAAEVSLDVCPGPEVLEAHQDWLRRYGAMEMRLSQLRGTLELLRREEVRPFLTPVATLTFVPVVRKACAIAGLGETEMARLTVAEATAADVLEALARAEACLPVSYQAALEEGRRRLEARLAAEAAGEAAAEARASVTAPDQPDGPETRGETHETRTFSDMAPRDGP